MGMTEIADINFEEGDTETYIYDVDGDDSRHGKKPVLCVGFDGVLHLGDASLGKGIVVGCPAPEAMDFLWKSVAHFEVCILSSRSRSMDGRRAMKQWLKRQLIASHGNGIGPAVYGALKWPWTKPKAFLYLDDRVSLFQGVFPSPEALLNFKPWTQS